MIPQTAGLGDGETWRRGQRERTLIVSKSHSLTVGSYGGPATWYNTPVSRPEDLCRRRSKKMTTPELAELFLAHLYDLAEAAPHPNFLFSVNDFAPRYGVESREELEGAIHYLGDRGLIILASLDMFGAISAGITMDGSVFVEQGGKTGMIKKYRENPGSFVVTPSEAPTPAVAPAPPLAAAPPVYGERPKPFYPGRAIEAILLDIEEALGNDPEVTSEMKKDLLSDLATLRIQVARNVKNKAVIKALIGSLTGIPSIAPLVTGLNCIVEAYFE
jgi:hypothetical protein